MRRPALALALGLALAAGTAARAAEKPSLPPPPPPAVKPEVKYKLGSGFTIAQAEDFTLQITGRIQARYTFENFDGSKDIPNVSDFTAERVRFGAKGTFFKDWKYELQADFGKGATSLRDAAIGYSHIPEFGFWMGQYKVRYDRQNYVSSGRQMFVDRAASARDFGLSRDLGLMLEGAPFEKKLQWNLGVFNGEKAPTPADANKNDGHLYVARVSINPNGDFGLAEGDMKKTDYHLWYIDVAAAWNNDVWKDANTDKKEQPGELTDTNQYTFGFGYRHAGFFLSGEYHDRHVEREDGTGDVDSNGWYAQFGYTIVRDKWEIAARYSWVDPNDDTPSNEKTETTLGLNRYFKGLGHSLKLNTDFSWLGEAKAAPSKDVEDFRLRSQLQVVF